METLEIIVFQAFLIFSQADWFDFLKMKSLVISFIHNLK